MCLSFFLLVEFFHAVLGLRDFKDTSRIRLTLYATGPKSSMPDIAALRF